MRTTMLLHTGLLLRPAIPPIRQLLSRSQLSSTPPRLHPTPLLRLLECPLPLPLWPMPSGLLLPRSPARSTSQKIPLHSSTLSSSTPQFSHHHVRLPYLSPLGTTSNNHPRSFTSSRHVPSSRALSQYRSRTFHWWISVVQILSRCPILGWTA